MKVVHQTGRLSSFRLVSSALVLLVVLLPALAQRPQPAFRAGQRVEVDVNMSSSPEYQSWKTGVINKVDLDSMGYWVAIEDGVRSRELIIPIRSPELYIRNAASQPAAENRGPAAGTQSSGNSTPPAASPAPAAGSRTETASESTPASPARTSGPPAPTTPAAPAPAATPAAAASSAPADSSRQAFKSAAECVVGIRVTDRMNRTGTVTGVNGTLCNITLDNGEKSSSIFWMLRAAGTAPADTGTLVTGTYKCYSLTGSTTNYMFMDVRIDSGTTYQDKGGKSGRYHVEASGKLVFESGPFQGVNAKVLPGPKIGMNMKGGTFFNTTCSLSR